MTKEEDFAIAYANLKGPRDKDYIGTAEALKRLKSYPEYNSDRKLAQHLPVSREMIREFLTLLKLPEEIQSQFGSEGLKLEHGRRLWQLTRKRRDLQREVAGAMAGLRAHEARHLVDYVLNHPDIRAAEARERILDAKPKVTKEYHVIAILSEVEYRALAKEARKKKLPVDALVTSIVQSWLASSSDPNG